MSDQLISILVLVAVFLIATVLPVHMGALALVAAFVVGSFVLTGPMEDKVDTVLGGFPGDLFVILVGVTYLFALAKENGTVDWLVHKAVRAVRGRVALIPWVMFAVTGIITAFGAVVPAAVAIIAPIGMSFARRYGINPLLMGLMVINGASAGGFSPLSIFGSITNGVVDKSDLEGSPTILFLSSLVFNIVLGIVTFILFGGRSLLGKIDTGDGEIADGSTGVPHDSGTGRAGGSRATTTAVQTTSIPRDETTTPVTTLDRNRTLTVLGMLALAVGALGFEIDVGFAALTLAVVLSVFSPGANKGAVSAIAWPTVLLICGIVTYVSLMELIGTIDWLGDNVAEIGTPLLAAILICFIGAFVSAFASTTGILGALIPLAVPFLLAGEVGAIGMISALAISSSVVDSSPFSTSGALVVANAGDDDRERIYKQLMAWGFSMCLIAPITTWAIFVVPGWG